MNVSINSQNSERNSIPSLNEPLSSKKSDFNTKSFAPTVLISSNNSSIQIPAQKRSMRFSSIYTQDELEENKAKKKIIMNDQKNTKFNENSQCELTLEKKINCQISNEKPDEKPLESQLLNKSELDSRIQIPDENVTELVPNVKSFVESINLEQKWVDPPSFQFDLATTFKNCLENRSCCITDVYTIMQEFKGAQKLERLRNKVADLINTPRSDQPPAMKEQLENSLLELKAIFPLIIFNPRLCKDWSEVLRTVVQKLSTNTTEEQDNTVKVITKEDVNDIK